MLASEIQLMKVSGAVRRLMHTKCNVFCRVSEWHSVIAVNDLGRIVANLFSGSWKYVVAKASEWR